MKLITRDTDYALRAVCFIARHNREIITTGRLVRELKIPRPFLRKILQVLNKKKILKSHKGRLGGFLLAVPPARLFLVSLIEIFQGPLKLNECFFKKKICPNTDTCSLRRKITHIEKYVIKELNSITIASLLR